ncbi:helix-turn-helix domain-containing protein [Trabulsiella guamensis]|nr:helix-turn-helix domain-containing protein [Trabulsiella guamensis]
MQFTQIPHDLAKIKTLVVQGRSKAFSLNHKIIYMYLLGWQQAGQQAFPSLRTMADLFALSKRTVQNTLDDLIDAGLVRKENRAYDSNLYSCTPLERALRILNAPQERSNSVVLRMKDSLMSHIDRVIEILENMMNRETKEEPPEDDDYLTGMKDKITRYDKDGW